MFELFFSDKTQRSIQRKFKWISFDMKIYILPRLKDFSVAGYLRGTEGSLQWRRLCGGTTSLERYSTFSTFPTIILTNICQSNKNIFKQCKLVVRSFCTYSLQIPLFYKAPGPNNSRGGWRKHITRYAEDYGHQEHPYFNFTPKTIPLDEVESILKFYGYSTEYSGNPRAASNPLNLKMKSGLYRELEYWGWI